MFSQIFTAFILFGVTFMENLTSHRPNQRHNNGAIPTLTHRNSIAFVGPPKIYLTVSSLIRKKVDRRLVINWEGIDVPPEVNEGPSLTITLYLHSSPVESININTPSGSFTTNTVYPHLATPSYDLNSNTSSPHCTPFHITLTSSKLNVTSSCLALYPTWMSTLAPVIGNTPLNLLFIPGTHDAGAYDNRPVNNYVNTQEESIYSQLVHGIRYLDIRVGHYNGNFFLNHAFVPVHPLSVILEDVNTFLRQFPQEVIIFDIHATPVGFKSDDNVHHELIRYLVSYLSPFLAPTNVKLTYNNLRAINSSVILTYPHSHIREMYNFLHRNVHHAWAETNKVDELLAFQEKSVERFGCGEQLWSSMMELTATPKDVVSKPFFGIRGFVNLVNPSIHTWYSDIEGFKKKSNIVATDFFLENNLIDLAFTYNKLGNNAQEHCRTNDTIPRSI